MTASLPTDKKRVQELLLKTAKKYTEADVETLKLIKILRRLDIPIEDIRHILDGEMEMDAVIQAYLRVLQEKKDGLDAVIRMCRIEEGSFCSSFTVGFFPQRFI